MMGERPAHEYVVWIHARGFPAAVRVSWRRGNPRARRNVSAGQRGPAWIGFSELPENRLEGIPAEVAHIMLLPWTQ